MYIFRKSEIRFDVNVYLQETGGIIYVDLNEYLQETLDIVLTEISIFMKPEILC